MKWALIGLGALFLLVVGLLAAAPYLVDAPKVQAAVAQAASQALGRPVRFRSLSLSLLPLPALRLKELQVAEDPRFGAAPFLTVSEGRLGLRVWPLVRGRLEATELVLDGPRVGLIQEPSGRWNIQSLGARPAGAPTAVKGVGAPSGGGLFPAVSRIRVAGGTLSYEARKKDGAPITYRLETLNFAASTAGPAAPVHFHGESRLTPGGLRLKIADGSLIPEAGRPLAESALKADVELSAEDIAPLLRAFLGPAREVGGPVRGKLALSGTPSRLAVQGELEFSRLRVSEHRATCDEPKTRSLTLESVRLPLTYSPFRLATQPLSARLGPGTAALALTLDFAAEPFVRFSEISVKALPLAPVLRDYLCHGYAVSAPLDLVGELAARPADLGRTLAGQGKLTVGAGRVVGPDALALVSGVVRAGDALSAVLNVDLPPALFASPLEFDSITASYRIVDGRLTTSDFLYSSARFKMAAAGEYGLADGRMNLDLALTSGSSEISARVTGTAASPAIRVRTPKRILEAAPSRLRELLRGLTGRAQ